ncbi:hypothetical protein NEOLEDRAFT_1135043 [Neolentinus lepideus HHB14362 ss-1]|uniref:Uncharacterized protein n=1 Tax=Neolentinus lepideus HHB14362 ss-1 TaxID=1314782 RepID=A0A165S314_9AGAM|nr:hypothetical protein NEOLEDRAFT_1135043 [Neolentinus lepideus HHB14362 ss-1]
MVVSSDLVPLSHVVDRLRLEDASDVSICAKTRILQGPTDLLKFFEAVSRLQGPVTSVEVEILEINPDEDDSWFNISPIYQCSDIRKFVLICPRMLPVTDDDAQTMLTMWRDLECLVLNPKPQNAPSLVPQMTFRTLNHVAEYGTTLLEAAFFLHARRNLQITATMPSETLQSLDLGLSPGHNGQQPDEIDRIALLLNGLFPKLDKFTWL